MVNFVFEEAVRKNLNLKLLISGTSGSGKTYSALSIAHYLLPEGKKIVIDTEKSAHLYAPGPNEKPDPTLGKFKFHRWDFTEKFKGYYRVDDLLAVIDAAEQQGFDIIIIDSLTPFWKDKGGILDMVEEKAKAAALKSGRNQNNFSAWNDGTAEWTKLIRKINDRGTHIICTSRAKTEYAQEGGKVTKLGLAEEVGKGIEYEFDVATRIDREIAFVGEGIGKTRCPALIGQHKHPGKAFADILKEWLYMESSARQSNVPMSDKERDKFRAFTSDTEALLYENTLKDELVNGVEGQYLTQGQAAQIIDVVKQNPDLRNKLQNLLKDHYKVTALVRVPFDEYMNIRKSLDPNYANEV